ncbi:MAG: hypothetical protein AAF639_27980, partial [Chloroflexota bacterium]
DGFATLSVPTTIITAKDDPVIPVEDFYKIVPHPLLDIQIYETGGHVGFIDILPWRHYLPIFVLRELEENSLHEQKY